MDYYITGNLDIASIALWLFTAFFVGLVIYIQRENMREGFPLENDDGTPNPHLGLPVPEPKTFKLPHGRGEVTVPDGKPDPRGELALKRSHNSDGFPFEPTGDPLVDGVGPAAWCARRDAPELDGHGHPKIIPMAASEQFAVSAGRDPRGMKVQAGDGEIVGTISDMWVDEPEQMVRYLEIELDKDHGGGKRLVPMTFAKITSEVVRIHAIFGTHFAAVPKTASPRQVTLLEEDKISAYYGGGKLYASDARLEPQL
ncbi:photosynthetic reaction center subunit H [Meridianimarinicoccus aquatilis]|uniref:Photosynthetic reaction center subunit H n=1 Tax=Meridianimarinicoccus aquatilis TaxID=2552766 RepID=A0A4R6AUZ2_9RHOB|nr:photosynthetic reaction center subunit H [Fluviibacterium aquatile]QIE42245.1 photosynthetic reaction center subunit H [Rhodobacteraceae bacterium SC52]TDL86056.1 photosynthetic reaction center subunit H [Fluviibacterium aquatile]